MKNLLLCFLLLNVFNFSFSQNKKDVEIIELYKNNFKNKPENIYTHLNKSNVLVNETLWFQSYIYFNQESIPYKSTTNVYYNIYNEDGALIDQKVFLAEDGFAKGQIKIGKNYKPGIYYLKTTTNWMRNFELNDSDYKIFVVNAETLSFLDNNTNISLNIIPEGGSLVYNTLNTVAIKFKGSYEKEYKNLKGYVTDNSNKIISPLNITKDGLGKFQFTPELNKNYTVSVYNRDLLLTSKSIAGIKSKGINISITEKKEIIQVTLRTNKASIKELAGKNHKLLIHRDGNIKDVNVLFNKNKTEYLFNFLKSDLLSGINILTVIDHNNIPVLERMLFNNTNLKTGIIEDITLNKIGDSSAINLKTNIKPQLASNFSITILPEGTKSINFTDNIKAKFLLSPYVKSDISVYDNYLEKMNREALYSLDLFLITEGASKQSFKSIINTKRTIAYPFDTGFQIVGKLNKTKYNKHNTLELISPVNGISLKEKLKEENYFSFNDLYLNKDSQINFVLRNKNKKTQKIFPYYNFYPKPIIDSLDINNTDLKQATPQIEEKFSLNSFIIETDAVELDTVTVTSEKRNKKPINDPISARKQDKVNIEGGGKFQLVIDFIRTQGFDVSRTGGAVQIVSRRGRSTSRFSPSVFLDNSPITNNLELISTLRMYDVEEMYVSKSGAGLGSSGAGGSISIFRKIGSKLNSRGLFKTVTLDFGFDALKTFELPMYSSTGSKYYEEYGIIDWKSNLKPNKQGDLNFKIPNLYKKSMVLIISGMDEAGNLYHTQKVLSFK